MKITFLQAANGSHFSKTITKTDTGFQVDPYPNIRNMNSVTLDFSTLADLQALLQHHADEGWCMLKGNTKRQLMDESRQGSHDPMAPTFTLSTDWDKMCGITSSQEAAELISLGHVSHIYQPSASAHYAPTTDSFNGHQTFLSKTPLHPGMLKAWLTKLNLEIPVLAEQLELTADGRGLRYKLDITICQNDKLNFIAPPICNGFTSLIKPEDQFQYIEGSSDFVELDLSQINVAQIAQQKADKIMELRKLAGLSTTKVRTKQMYNREVITNPENAMVTDIREQGDFIRLNINNGDSWAYWHPVDNWEVIYSFKDEEAYEAKAFVPDYYQICQNAASDRREVHSTEGDPDIRYIGFVDAQSDKFVRGTWNPKTLDLKLHPTSTRDKLENFFRLHNIAVPEALPEWDYRFAFDDVRFIDFEDGFINKYVTPRIVLDAITKPKATRIALTDFPTIHRIACSALGDDLICVDHFYNWIAVRLQFRLNPFTAWLLQGTTGTGKGHLFHKVLAKLFGLDYVAVSRLQDLLNRFNRFDETKILVLVDEADMEMVTQEEAAISGSLKTLITEPMVPFEGKGQQRRHVPNHCCYIFTSNQPTPVHVEYNDRRFNTAPRQEKPLEYIEDMDEKIEAELPLFAQFLHEYEADIKRSRTPLKNETNTQMRRSGLSSLHEITAALREGDFEYFVTNLPFTKPAELVEAGELSRYITTLMHISQQQKGQTTKLTRVQAESLFIFLDDKTPRKNKFTTMLRRQGLDNKVIWDSGRSTRGYEVEFSIEPQIHANFLKAWKNLGPGSSPVKEA